MNVFLPAVLLKNLLSSVFQLTFMAFAAHTNQSSTGGCYMCLVPKCCIYDLAFLFLPSLYSLLGTNLSEVILKQRGVGASYIMEKLGLLDWSLVTILVLIISTSALVLGHEGEIHWVLLKYLQNYTKAGIETLTVNVLHESENN